MILASWSLDSLACLASRADSAAFARDRASSRSWSAFLTSAAAASARSASAFLFRCSSSSCCCRLLASSCDLATSAAWSRWTLATSAAPSSEDLRHSSPRCDSSRASRRRDSIRPSACLSDLWRPSSSCALDWASVSASLTVRSSLYVLSRACSAAFCRRFASVSACPRACCSASTSLVRVFARFSASSAACCSRRASTAAVSAALCWRLASSSALSMASVEDFCSASSSGPRSFP
mmetsp:Transcript_13694/g.38907  ORF Transcript_13694/g.38907 Transcript_13694/m.38907 type:complete len:236 (+) Transcript_13694:1114-1821(+)